VRHLQRPYCGDDLHGIFLVIGATDDAALNRRIHADAEQAGRLCNIADQPHLCNFILPAVVNQGDLTIAVSTGGKSPAFAKYLRRQLAAQFGPEYGAFLTLMGAVRAKLLRAQHAPETHKPLFEDLISRGLLDAVRAEDHRTIDHILVSVLGRDFSYDQLDDQLKDTR
jgi:precorrin-2 dehydrogenase/sirohydrochlorin ferrochelatase